MDGHHHDSRFAIALTLCGFAHLYIFKDTNSTTPRLPVPPPRYRCASHHRDANPDSRHAFNKHRALKARTAISTASHHRSVPSPPRHTVCRYRRAATMCRHRHELSH
ncbi:hypothetical protein E2542_SST09347 [Spatholobus suberectus]|nr:hypothetical protein E2542_SST09347 [Spatholobus suberectus]